MSVHEICGNDCVLLRCILDRRTGTLCINTEIKQSQCRQTVFLCSVFLVRELLVYKCIVY